MLVAMVTEDVNPVGCVLARFGVKCHPLMMIGMGGRRAVVLHP